MMISLKTYEQTQGYEYQVCEVTNCSNPAVKVFVVQARYVEVCEKHHNDMINISYIS